MGFPDGSVVKNPSANAEDTGDMSLIPGSGKSPWGGNGNSLQYSCLENPLDSGAWQALVHEVAKNWTQLSNWAHTHFLFQAWRIWAQKAKQRQQLWRGNTKYYLGPFSTRGAMYASLSPSFLTPWRVLSPSSGIPFHVSLLLSNPQLTEHLVLKHYFYSKDYENSWIFNDILCLIPVAHWMIHPLGIFCKSSCGYSIWIPGLHENAPQVSQWMIWFLESQEINHPN